MDFREYIKRTIASDKKILEFGPLNRPLFKKENNANIYYADIRNTEEIKKLYTNNDYLKKTGIKVDVESIVDIDYKISGDFKNTFKAKKFDIIYLSHVIEHMPNIIGFFQEASNILKKDGQLIIIYPDKRYCFDHFRNESSFRDAYATYKYGLKENARLAFDFSYNVANENDPLFFWNNKNISSKLSQENIVESEKYYNDILENKNLDDIHFWPFSDIGFLYFLYEMVRASLLNYKVEYFHPCEENTQEFLIILKKSENISENKDSILFNIDTFNQKQANLIKLSDNLKEIISVEKNKYETLFNDYIKLNKDLENIQNSKSMKITYPLRMICKKFKSKGNKFYE